MLVLVRLHKAKITEDTRKDIAENVETKFDTSKYELNKTLPKGKNREVIGVMNNKFCEKVMKEFVGLKAVT